MSKLAEQLIEALVVEGRAPRAPTYEREVWDWLYTIFGQDVPRVDDYKDGETFDLFPGHRSHLSPRDIASKLQSARRSLHSVSVEDDHAVIQFR